MTGSASLSQARADVVRERVIAAVAALLDEGRPLTFKEVAAQAGVPERTVYRHFPTRSALMTAVFAWTNEQIGVDGSRPEDRAGLAEHVRTSFRGFDELAPVVRQMLAEPDGRDARLADVAERRHAAVALVDHEAPGLETHDRDRVAAAVQVLTVAATWQSLRENWDLDGADAAGTAVLAVELLLDGARARAEGTTP